MANLNKINEIGDVQAQLDADAATESLKQQEFTRIDLDTHASSVDVNDKDLFTAITAAKTEVDLFLADNPSEAEIKGLINNLEAAIGGPFNSEEGIWLAQQLGIADELSLAGGPAPAPEVSPEKIAELTAFLTEAEDDFKTLDIDFSLEEIISILGDPGVAEQIEAIQLSFPAVKWVIENEDVMTALNNSSDYRALNDGSYLSAEQVEVVMALKSALEGKTDAEERAQIIAEQLGDLPDPNPAPDPSEGGPVSEEALNGSLQALFDGVPDSMQSMFSTEYEAWKAAMLEPDATRISFNDYLVEQANGDQGTLSTIALKMQLANIIEMLKPFIEAIKSLTGQGTEADADKTETDAERVAREEEALQIRAAEHNRTPEEQRQVERLAAIKNYFEADGAPVIEEFYDMEVTPKVYSETKTQSFLAKTENATFKLEDVQALETSIKGLVSPEKAELILQKGLGYKTLNAIANLPTNAIENITETGISLGKEGTEISFEPATDFNERLKTAIDAFRTETTRALKEAAEKEAQTAFLNTIRTTILEKAVAQFDEDNVTLVEVGEDKIHVDNNGESRGFVINSGKIYLDMDRTGPSVDLNDLDLALMDLTEINLSELGFADNQAMLEALRDEFSGKTIAQIRSNS